MDKIFDSFNNLSINDELLQLLKSVKITINFCIHHEIEEYIASNIEYYINQMSNLTNLNESEQYCINTVFHVYNINKYKNEKNSIIYNN